MAGGEDREKNYETEYNLLKTILATLTLFSFTIEEAMCSFKKMYRLSVTCCFLPFAYATHTVLVRQRRLK